MGPQVYKFKQVSTDDHQISLRGLTGPGPGGLIPDVQRGPGVRAGEGACTVRSHASLIMVTDRQTATSENIL